MKSILLALTTLLFIGTMNTATSYGENKTILLDESIIQGTQLGNATSPARKKSVAGPALSTSLRWDGEKTSELNIPKEILDHLTRADLSFFSNRSVEVGDLDDEIFFETDD